ncbi:MAG: hypothetical protein KJ799_17455 [Bacteroidetes bacterium]|nr:hypothetical protein [Bacteroidota bacterium]
MFKKIRTIDDCKLKIVIYPDKINGTSFEICILGFSDLSGSGFKQNYFQNEIVSSAVWGSYFIKAEGGMIGNTISVGERNKSIHVGIASVFNSDSENEIIFMFGGRYDTSEKLSLIAEYMNAAELMDTEFKGLLTFGFRFRSENISWELAGIRPLADTGDLFLIPLLKATFYFE